jgi:hypothetical protein
MRKGHSRECLFPAPEELQSGSAAICAGASL